MDATKRDRRRCGAADDAAGEETFGIGCAATARRDGHVTMRASRLGPTHHVLVVDDDDDVREAFLTLLASEGFTVATAAGVEEAYRHVREGFRPCVVLLDLQMPDLDGWAFLDRVETERGLTDVPVLVVSGKVDQQGRAVARGLDFLVKPLDARTLIAAVECHCRHHRA